MNKINDLPAFWGKFKQKYFLMFYDVYYPRLYAYTLCRIKNKEQAEDIVQQTFLKVVENKEKFNFKNKNSFVGWLFTVTKNQIADFYRNNKEVLYSDESFKNQASAENSPVEEFINKEFLEESLLEQKRVIELIFKLKPAEKDLILLKYVAGLNYKEISKLVGVSENTLAVRLFRVIKKLKKLSNI